MADSPFPNNNRLSLWRNRALAVEAIEEAGTTAFEAVFSALAVDDVSLMPFSALRRLVDAMPDLYRNGVTPSFVENLYRKHRSHSAGITIDEFLAVVVDLALELYPETGVEAISVSYFLSHHVFQARGLFPEEATPVKGRAPDTSARKPRWTPRPRDQYGSAIFPSDQDLETSGLQYSLDRSHLSVSQLGDSSWRNSGRIQPPDFSSATAGDATSAPTSATAAAGGGGTAADPCDVDAIPSELGSNMRALLTKWEGAPKGSPEAKARRAVVAASPARVEPIRLGGSRTPARETRSGAAGSSTTLPAAASSLQAGLTGTIGLAAGQPPVQQTNPSVGKPLGVGFISPGSPYQALASHLSADSLEQGDGDRPPVPPSRVPSITPPKPESCEVRPRALSFGQQQGAVCAPVYPALPPSLPSSALQSASTSPVTMEGGRWSPDVHRPLQWEEEVAGGTGARAVLANLPSAPSAPNAYSGNAPALQLPQLSTSSSSLNPAARGPSNAPSRAQSRVTSRHPSAAQSRGSSPPTATRGAAGSSSPAAPLLPSLASHPSMPTSDTAAATLGHHAAAASIAPPPLPQLSVVAAAPAPPATVTGGSQRGSLKGKKPQQQQQQQQQASQSAKSGGAGVDASSTRVPSRRQSAQTGPAAAAALPSLSVSSDATTATVPASSLPTSPQTSDGQQTNNSPLLSTTSAPARLSASSTEGVALQPKPQASSLQMPSAAAGVTAGKQPSASPADAAAVREEATSVTSLPSTACDRREGGAEETADAVSSGKPASVAPPDQTCDHDAASCADTAGQVQPTASAHADDATAASPLLREPARGSCSSTKLLLLLVLALPAALLGSLFLLPRLLPADVYRHAVGWTDARLPWLRPMLPQDSSRLTPPPPPPAAPSFSDDSDPAWDFTFDVEDSSSSTGAGSGSGHHPSHDARGEL